MWWQVVRSRLPARILTRLPYRPQLTVPAIVGDATNQRQMFARAVRCFTPPSTPIPQVTITPQDPPPSIGLLHAAAALAAHTGTDEVIDTTITVVGDLFTIERQRWQAPTTQAQLDNLPTTALDHALLLAALVGAPDEQAARQILTHLPTRPSDHVAGRLADWLRGLYPLQQEPDWLAPHLPAVLIEQHAVYTVAATPALAAALATATTTTHDAARAGRLLTTLARAGTHSAHAVAAVTAVLNNDSHRMITTAITVALSVRVS